MLTTDDIIYAHSADSHDKSDWEPLDQHLKAVARRTAKYTATFGAEEIGSALGLLHDLGKAKPRFQQRLLDSSIVESHSGEGARALADAYPRMGRLLAHCIAGHHTGLSNATDQGGLPPLTPLDARLEEAEQVALPEGIEFPQIKGNPPPPPLLRLQTERDGKERGYMLAFFTRMLFSALVDADRVETARFYGNFAGTQKPDLCDLANALHKTIENFGKPVTDINVIRAEIHQNVCSKAKDNPGTVFADGANRWRQNAYLSRVRPGPMRENMALPA